MSKPVVPPAPLPSWEVADNERKNEKRMSLSRPRSVSTATPLDAAFLCRVYRSILWFGVLTTGLVYSAWSSLPLTLAYASGVVLGAMLLKTQEMFGRRLFRSKSSPRYEGWDRRIPLWLLVPAKYVLVFYAMNGAITNQKNPTPLIIAVGFGFISVHVMIMAKIFGKVLSEQSRSVREVYVESQTKA